jgi:phage terminase large subunit-like protein
MRAPAKPFTLPHFRAWASDLILDTGESWHPERFQEAFLEDVFSGCPECWLVVPEGNGKTTLVAGLGLYHCEHRPHASVPIAASSREQAEIMYRQAEGFVLRSERLYASVESPIAKAKGKRTTEVPRFVCLEGYRRINHFEGGRIQVFAADDRTGDGIIPTLGILDEMHRHRDLALYRTWAGKLQKRRGQIVGISTAGEPGSDFEKTRELVRKRATTLISRGAFTRAASPGMVLHEWAMPAEDSPRNFRAVKRANPFSGITVPILREKFARPTMTMQHWLRFVCNRPTRSVAAAIEEAEWRAAATKEEIPVGEPIWLGLDVAWKWDTTAAVPLYWRDPMHRLLGPARILVPPRDGTSLDPHDVEDALSEIHARNPIHTVVMDMSRAEQLAAWMTETLGARVIDWPQSNVFAAGDYEHFMEALRSGWLHHAGDEGLTAHVLNAVTRLLPSGNARFDRPAETRNTSEQDHRVIDGLTAAAMVNSAASTPDEPEHEPALLGLLRELTAADVPEIPTPALVRAPGALPFAHEVRA